jgi:glycosyltransferase involved in cell wall biosynthesis
MENQQVIDDVMIDVSIVLAVYNEELSLKKELEIIKKTMDSSSYSYEVIVVDDASTDKTPEILSQYNWVKSIRHPVNKGSGGARKTGTLASKGELVVWSDVDLTYPNHLIPKLVDELVHKGYDQVVGARRVEAGSMQFLRRPAKWLIRKLAIVLSGTNIPDLNSGLRVIKKGIALKYLHLLPMGFSCVSTITLAFLCNGYTVGYYPIDYKERVGRSKFHPVKDTYLYLIQVVRMVMFFNPLKIFLPLSIFFCLLGVATSTYNIGRTGGVQQIDIIIILFGMLIGLLGLLADLIVVQNNNRNP